jgi:pyruvate,water dikinase
VFHLRLEELEATQDPAAAAESGTLAAAVHSRSARRRELAGVRLIDPSAVFPRQQIGEALIAGTGASSGTATGPVKVIREPAEFGRLVAGDVLVCPYTNPAWTPLFQRAAAVVVDSGGLGSHAAIVAREYSIPAVMGTGTGTSALTDGQLVTVDGAPTAWSLPRSPGTRSDDRPPDPSPPPWRRAEQRDLPGDAGRAH